MDHQLDAAERRALARYRDFAREVVAPVAASCDREQRVPRAILERLAREGCLGLGLPAAAGGGAASAVTFGLLAHELARASASVHGVFNVHHMASVPLARWGTDRQRRELLPALARGERLAAIAVTEPDVGSDAGAVVTEARAAPGGFLLNGRKRWITCAQVADDFLVLAKVGAQPTAFWVQRDQPGFRIEPIDGMLGCRGYMVGQLDFEDCFVDEGRMVGRVGFGLACVAIQGFDVGRYGLAWGCAGMAQACLDACVEHAGTREQFGVPIREHQLVQRMIARMAVATRSARMQSLAAGRLRDQSAPHAMMETTLAKYQASTALQAVAADAVQIHGAIGCGPDHPMQRIFRDAKIMELIEGSTQVLETAVAEWVCRRGGARFPAAAGAAARERPADARSASPSMRETRRGAPPPLQS